MSPMPARAVARLLATAVLAVCLPPLALATAPDDPPPPAQTGDREQLRQVMLDARIATDRSKPSLALWARDAGVAFSRWMSEWMERVLPGFARVAMPWVEPAMMILLALLAAILFALLARYAFDRWRRRMPGPSPDVEPLAAAAKPAAERDWAGELRRRLANGDAAGGIEALWWWLASRLVADRAEPSWTSRELVARAGRRDLLAAVRRLDRMMYGAAQPSAGEVGRLWSDLEEAVG